MAKSRKDSKGRVLRKGETVRSNGKYQYAYTDYYGKRQYVYANDLVTLRQKEEEILKDQWDGIDSQAARNQSLNDLNDKYMATRKDFAPRTYIAYVYQYDAHVRQTLGKRKIKDVRYSDILRFYKSLMEDHNLAIGSVQHIHLNLHQVFEMAVRDCIIRVNPTHSVIGQIKRQSGAKPVPRKALTPEQQKAFLQFMDENPVYERWRPIYKFLIGTGVRVGELGGLRWCDVDFENGYISIDHAIVYVAGRMNKSDQKLYISKPKTEAGIRKIPMVKQVREALDEIKQYQFDNGIFCKVNIDGYTDFIFLNRDGRILSKYALDRALSRIIVAYNEYETQQAAEEKREAVLLPHFTCHTLRHTFCTRFCENETNLKVIQSVMGHVDIGTTMNIYAEVSDAKKKESMEALAEKLVLF